MEMYDERKRSQICNLSGFFYTTAQIGFYFRGSHSTTFLWLMINGIYCMGFFMGMKLLVESTGQFSGNMYKSDFLC